VSVRRGCAGIPAGIVSGHLQDQRTDSRGGLRPSRRSARVGPMSPDKIGVPAQQGPRRDDQAQLAKLAAGQQPGQRGQAAQSAQGNLGTLTCR
jgi:hypothetical protein